MTLRLSPKFILVFFVFTTGIVPVFTQTCNFKEEIAEGYAPIISSEEAAREEAKKDALRQAVGAVGGVIIESTTRVAFSQLVSDEISTRTVGYAVSHEIIGENANPEGTIYTVQVKACVNPDVPEDLVQDIQAEADSLSEILKRKFDNPEIVIQVEGTENPAVIADTKRLLDEHFKELGFAIINRTSESCQSLAGEITSADAKIILCAETTVVAEPTTVGSRELFTANATINLSALLVGNNLQIASASSSTGQFPSSLESKAAKDAVANAFSQPISEDLNVLDAFTFELIGNLKRINIVVKGLPDLQSFQQVKAVLESILGAENVQDRGWSDGQGAFSVQSAFKALDLATQLQAAAAVNLKVTGQTTFSIEAQWAE